MKFRIVTALVVAAGLASAINAHAAGSVGSPFNVNATLTSGCILGTTTPSNIDFGVYQAFGAEVVKTTTVTFQCTRGLAMNTAIFDTGTNASNAAASASPSGGGVLAGLAYTLTSTSSRGAGTASTAGVAGTPDIFSYVFTGTIPAGQAGCTGLGTVSEACGTTSQTRTLTVSY